MTTKRRGRGEASVYQDGARWRGAVSLGWDVDGNRVRKKVSGRTKAEVLAKLRELQRGIDAGLPVPDDRLTVGAFLDRWLTVSLPGHVDDSTRHGYEVQVRRHLKPAVGRRPLTKLAVAELDAVWRAKLDQGYSANSVRIMRTVLRKALAQAEREGLVPRNVAALSTPPRVRASVGQALTVVQARALLDGLAGHRHEALVLVMLTYGLRRGEALGLRRDQLDLDGGRLAVTSAVKRVRDESPGATSRTRLVVGDVKTPRSRRTLFLTEPVTAALRSHLAGQAAERLAAGRHWEDHGLIFCNEVGRPLDPDAFSHWFTRLCRDAGMGHWHPHDLRHSGASLMLAQGVPLHVVSEVLGHASIAITKDVYGHLVEGDKRRAAESMSSLFARGDAEAGEGIGSQDGSPRRPKGREISDGEAV